MGKNLSPSISVRNASLSPMDARADRDLNHLLAFLKAANLPNLDRYLRQTLGTDLTEFVENAISSCRSC
ncbi:MAG: hypothetical protein J6Y32_00215 [Bacteroidales bacterium]|nr:hypothetical protein [Bacteroidales bacterium]